MRNLILIGGRGSGKTTLATALRAELPDFCYVYTSVYTVRVPLTLIKSTDPKVARPNLLELSRKEYVRTVMANANVPELPFSREELDQYAFRLVDRYGEAVISDIVLAVAQPGRQYLFDNVARAANIRYLKDKGFFVVGLHASHETRIRRRHLEGRDIDPKDRSDLERQIEMSDEFFQITDCLPLADRRYNTDEISANSPKIVREIVEAIR